MSDIGGIKELFPVDEEKLGGPNVIEYRKTGVLPYQALKAMVDAKEIDSLVPFTPDQLQPASIDLRIGPRAYRVRASFLPGRESKVMDRIAQLDGLPSIDLTKDGAALERGAVYVVELLESLKLPSTTEGVLIRKVRLADWTFSHG